MKIKFKNKSRDAHKIINLHNNYIIHTHSSKSDEFEDSDALDFELVSVSDRQAKFKVFFCDAVAFPSELCFLSKCLFKFVVFPAVLTI